MTLEQYVRSLSNLMVRNRKAKNFIIVSAGDEEGNSFFPVQISPTVGHYDKNSSNFIVLNMDSIYNLKKNLRVKLGSEAETIIEKIIKETENDIKTKKLNAVCIS